MIRVGIRNDGVLTHDVDAADTAPEHLVHCRDLGDPTAFRQLGAPCLLELLTNARSLDLLVTGQVGGQRSRIGRPLHIVLAPQWVHSCVWHPEVSAKHPEVRDRLNVM